MSDEQPKAWEVMKEMLTEFEQHTEHFPEPDLNKIVVERAMDVIEAATAVTMVVKDGISPLATMEQLQEAVAAFHDLSKPRMEQDDDDEMVIVLTDEDGNETEWTIATVVKVDDRDYALLTPLVEVEGADAGMMIYRLDYNAETDEDELADITDEAEFERVAGAMLSLLDEEDAAADGEQTPERIHVIRVQTDKMTVAEVTKPTTSPATEFEADALKRYPGAISKPTRTYHPDAFAILEAAADEAGLTIDEVIERGEARQAEQQ